MKKSVKIVLAVVVLIIAGIYITFLLKDLKSSNNAQNEAEAIAQGVEVIKDLEEQNTVQIEEKIKSVKSRNGVSNGEASQGVDYKSKFSSTVIAGDSRAEGFSVYGYLTQSSVVAEKGRNITTVKSKGDIDKIVNLAPENVIFVYGVNDVLCYKDSKPFIDGYAKVIDEVKKRLPKSELYVCSIFPVQDFAANSRPNFKNIPSWNEDLKKLCKKKKITYLDALPILQESDYEGDGVHFKGSFQKKWLDFFIQELNL